MDRISMRYIFFFMLLLSQYSCAASPQEDEEHAAFFLSTAFRYPSERTYKVALPPPFNVVEVQLLQTADAELSSISVHWMGNDSSLGEDSLPEALTKLGEAEFTFSIPSEGSEVDSFVASFYFGDGEVVVSPNGNRDRVRNVVRFLVSRSGAISYEIIDFISAAR